MESGIRLNSPTEQPDRSAPTVSSPVYMSSTHDIKEKLGNRLAELLVNKNRCPMTGSKSWSRFARQPRWLSLSRYVQHPAQILEHGTALSLIFFNSEAALVSVKQYYNLL